MEIKNAVTCLSALAQESRLAVFRLLVEAGSEGMSPGRISETLAIPASSLSFHLKELTHAGLAQARHEGRSIIYTADFGAMQTLVDFLTENCCGGAGCEAVPRPRRMRR